MYSPGNIANIFLDCVFIYLFKEISKTFKINLFIYLWLPGLRCCARAFSSCFEQGLLFVAVRGLLTAVASFIAEYGL